MTRSSAPRRSTLRRADEHVDASREGGFTVLEVVVAIALVTIVMTSLAVYFVDSNKLSDLQGQKQSAIRVATNATEKARSLTSIGMTYKRDQTSSQALWGSGSDATKFPGVAPYLTDVTMAYDTKTTPLAVNAGYSAPLPTDGEVVTRDGIDYTQNWFIGTCLRDTTGKCVTTSGVTFLRLVVAVTWSNRGCRNGVCSYVTATLVSPTQDPAFDASKTASKPRIANPGDQRHEEGQTVALPISVRGGTTPMTWTPPTLPDGLNWGTDNDVCPSSTVCIYGAPTTATPTNSPAVVVLEVTDAFGFTSSAAFNWTITPGPSITAVAARSTRTGTADTLNVTVTGGTAAFDWSKTTGLPPGMSISGTTSTGKITGTPTRGGVYTVSLKVVDSLGVSDTVTFTWEIKLGGSLTNGKTTGPSNGKYTCSWDVDVYGTAPFTWTASDPNITITTSNGTNHALFTVKVSYGTYNYTFAAKQTSSGSTLDGYSTCYAGTK